MDRLRIGILGAAEIAPPRWCGPPAASRRRTSWRSRRVIPRAPSVRRQARHRASAPVLRRLVADPEIDAVYNPLPTACTASGPRRVAAGKHVLCEKPIAANAAEARAHGRRAAETGRVRRRRGVSLALPPAGGAYARDHRRRRARDGASTSRRHFSIPLLSPGDIRYRLELAGGATMDVGCYAISIACASSPAGSRRWCRRVRSCVHRRSTGR